MAQTVPLTQSQADANQVTAARSDPQNLGAKPGNQATRNFLHPRGIPQVLGAPRRAVWRAAQHGSGKAHQFTRREANGWRRVPASLAAGGSLLSSTPAGEAAWQVNITR